MPIKMMKSLLLMMLVFINIPSLSAKEHPNLILTQEGVEQIRKNLGKVPLFDASLAKVKAIVDAEIADGIDTPIPKDFSGGYTHYRHKQNFIIAQQAGVLYQILQDDKYAVYVRDMLFQYEAMYKNLPIHPMVRSYAPGKLFWQCLNDSNWLVYMSQAYDTVYNFLSAQERSTLENNLFRPFADYISLANPAFYNRVHNHSTWGNAAVGMIGLVMDDEELIKRALYGIVDDGLEVGGIDNDGGTIKVEGQKRGFLANLQEPFSPDGYYTEGPYYQRYAMYPFLIFALGMENAKPELGVMQHKDNVLLKGVDALLNLTDADGEFFPLNDGQKGMSYFTPSLVTAVNVAYHYGGYLDADGKCSCHGYKATGGWRFGNHIDGTQAEYVLVPDAQANLCPVPDGLTDEQVLMCPDIMSTGFKGAENANIQIGDMVAIFAQGPIGLCATAGAKLKGASLIIAIDANSERLAMAKKLGADITLNYTKVDVVDEIMKITGGRGVDSSIEALGLQSTFNQCIKVLKPGGTFSSLGVYSEDLVIPIANFAAGLGDHTIRTALCPGGKERMRRLMNVIETGRVDLSEMVTHTYALDDIVDAYDLFMHQRDGVLKIAIKP